MCRTTNYQSFSPRRQISEIHPCHIHRRQRCHSGRIRTSRALDLDASSCGFGAHYLLVNGITPLRYPEPSPLLLSLSSAETASLKLALLIQMLWSPCLWQLSGSPSITLYPVIGTSLTPSQILPAGHRNNHHEVSGSHYTVELAGKYPPFDPFWSKGPLTFSMFQVWDIEGIPAHHFLPLGYLEVPPIGHSRTSLTYA